MNDSVNIWIDVFGFKNRVGLDGFWRKEGGYFASIHVWCWQRLKGAHRPDYTVSHTQISNLNSRTLPASSEFETLY